jgi:hypothetical protein
MAFTTGATICAQDKPAVPAAPPAPPPPPPSAGLFNDWLRQQSEAAKHWNLGAQFRARMEFKHNFAVPSTPGAVDFAAKSPASENNYLLLRTRVHLGYTPCDWFTVFAEGQEASSTGDKRNPNPESNGPFDLHQGYVNLGNAKKFPLTAKVGRQELAYGDERLIGTFDWSNLGRVFDAAKVRLENSDGWIDGFVSRIVIQDDNNLDLPNDYDFFSGLYASSRTVLPKQETQLYFLARNVSSESPNAIGPGLPPNLTGATPRDIYTLGFRFRSLPGELKGWDYGAEVAGQLGDFAYTATGPRLDHEAWAAHVAGGYTFTKAWGTPRVGLEYNYASGDTDPTDNQHGTFDNLFPTNHRFYGYMDFFSWQNLHNPRFSASIKPVKGLTLTADYHAFWLAETSDFFYQANGQPRNTGGYGIYPNADSFVGQEVDVIATYSWKTIAQFQAGYGHFFVGDYVEDSLAATGGASDADFVYLQLTLNF